MSKRPLAKKVTARIDRMVVAYVARREEFANLAQRVERDLVEHAKLRPFIHSTKRREKDPEHLRGKLERQAYEARDAGKEFTLTEHNMFDDLGDLAGVRLLHIHTDQLSTI